MKRNFTILILFCLLTVSACGIFGGEPRAAKLLTRADAEKIMGVPVTFEKEKFAEQQSTCIYTSGDEYSHVQMTIQRYSSENEAQEAYEFMKKLNRDFAENMRTLEGVGDGAWIEDHAFSQTIYVRRRNFAFLIAADGAQDSEQKSAELRRVAEQVAARL